MLLATPSPSSAASYSLAFAGTVTDSTGVFPLLGIAPGDPVSGTIAIDPLDEVADFGLFGSFEFEQAVVAYTFQVAHSPAFLPFSDSGSGSIDTVRPPAPLSHSIHFNASSFLTAILLSFGTDNVALPAISSLTGLPNTPQGLLSLLGGANPRASGVFSLGGGASHIYFDVALTAVTPIPAALPLFAAALGGLGFIGWRRRASSGSSG